MKNFLTKEERIKLEAWTDSFQRAVLENMDTPVSSELLRAERRAKKIKAFFDQLVDVMKIAIGIVVGVGMLWIIQVGVTSI